MKNFFKTYGLHIAWFQALIGTFGSLYLSEILHLPPCSLCWYQRVLYYPLAIILAVAIIKKEKFILWYVLPFTIIGTMIALFHTLLQWGIIPDAIAPCISGISCTSKQINILGFITIPFMSLVGFTIMNISVFLFKKLNDSHEPRN